MARTKRSCPAGEVFHVLNRAVARLTIFEKPEDYAAFMRVLEETWQIIPLPIYAMAEKHGTCEVTTLYKGVVPVPFCASNLDPKEVNHRAVETLRAHNVVADGDLVLITKGDFVNVHGGTNTLKIVRVGDVIQ